MAFFKGFTRSRLIVVGFLALSLLLIAAKHGLMWWWEDSLGRKELAYEIAWIREQGQPLSTSEVNERYQADAHRPDMTKEMLAALDTIEKNCSTKILQSYLDAIEKNEPSLLPNDLDPFEQLNEMLLPLESVWQTLRQLENQGGTVRYPDDFTLGMQTKLFAATHLQTLSKSLRLKFYLHIVREEWDLATECPYLYWIAAKTIRPQPCLVSQNLYIGLLTQALIQIEHLQHHAKLSDESWLKLRRLVQEIDFYAGVSEAILGERASTFACISHMEFWKNKRSAAEVITANGWRTSRPRDAALALTYYRRLVSAHAESYKDYRAEAMAIEQEIKARSTEYHFKRTFTGTGMMMPAFSAFNNLLDSAKAFQTSVDTSIAAELYFRKAGRWPDSPSELVPEFLPSLPKDPFVAQPLTFYADEKSIGFYSLGFNLKDDGGLFPAFDSGSLFLKQRLNSPMLLRFTNSEYQIELPTRFQTKESLWLGNRQQKPLKEGFQIRKEQSENEEVKPGTILAECHDYFFSLYRVTFEGDEVDEKKMMESMDELRRIYGKDAELIQLVKQPDVQIWEIIKKSSPPGNIFGPITAGRFIHIKRFLLLEHQLYSMECFHLKSLYQTNPVVAQRSKDFFSSLRKRKPRDVDVKE